MPEVGETEIVTLLSAVHTLLTNEAGGIIDDLMIARLDANALFLVGNASRKGDIFIGTQWADADGRKYEFYLLSPGPEGFTLPNRLWEMSTE